MSFRLHINQRAAADMLDVYEFIALRSPEAAERTVALLQQSIRGLSEFPNRYALAPENPHAHLTIRHLIVGNYRILFSPTETTVVILAIVHAAHRPLNPADLF